MSAKADKICDLIEKNTSWWGNASSDFIKRSKERKKYTLQQLSKKTGISTTHINDIENKMKEPSFSMMVRLSCALNVPLDKLYKIIW
ncbi:MAG: helix-turn-helix transcriptional regulator [Clostridia bacterium]|nr:helix-turn-helix transcriptional regulator [Clostridia bacterium]